MYYKILFPSFRQPRLYKSNVCRFAEQNDLPTCCVVLTMVEFGLLNGRQYKYKANNILQKKRNSYIAFYGHLRDLSYL